MLCSTCTRQHTDRQKVSRLLALLITLFGGCRRRRRAIDARDGHLQRPERRYTLQAVSTDAEEQRQGIHPDGDELAQDWKQMKSHAERVVVV